MATRTLAATLIAALTASPDLAHHSRTNFDLDSTIEIKGTVTEFTRSGPGRTRRLD